MATAAAIVAATAVAAATASFVASRGAAGSCLPPAARLPRFRRTGRSGLSLAAAPGGDDREVLVNYIGLQSYDRSSTGGAEAASAQEANQALGPWTDAERDALALLESEQPAWRKSYLGPETEEDVRATFRAIAGVVGSEADALVVLRRNLAVLVFTKGQLQAAGQVLIERLGRERAREVILKNPGVLTIEPEMLKKNMDQTLILAEVVGFFADNPLLSRILFGVLLLGLIYAVIGVGVIAPLVRNFPGAQGS